MHAVLELVLPALVLLLSILVDLLDGERREKSCPLHPVRICWLLGTRILGHLRNTRLHGVLLWLSTVTPLVLVYSVLPVIVLRSVHASSPLVLIILSAVLLKWTFSYRLLDWYISEILKALEQGSEARARVLLQEIVRRDVFALSREHVVSAAIETYFESLVDGFLSPLFWYAVLDVPGAYLQRLANTMDSLVGYPYKPFDKIGYFSAKVDTILNYIPARLLCGLILLLRRVSLSRVTWIAKMSGIRSVNARIVFACISESLKVRLEKPGEYSVGFYDLPTVKHLREGLRLGRELVVVSVALLALVSIARQVCLLVLVDLLAKLLKLSL